MGRLRNHKVKTFPFAKQPACPEGITDNNACTLPQSSLWQNRLLSTVTRCLSKCFSQVPEAQSLDNTSEVWSSYTGIKRQPPAPHTPLLSKLWKQPGQVKKNKGAEVQGIVAPPSHTNALLLSSAGSHAANFTSCWSPWLATMAVYPLLQTTLARTGFW